MSEPSISTVEALGNESLSLLTEALRLAYASTGVELQAEMINRLADMEDRVSASLDDASQRGDENAAQIMFALVRYIRGIAAFLWMWLDIKRDEMDGAWAWLIDAQQQIERGLRFMDKDGMKYIARVLLALEQVLFPPQKFVSSSLIYDHAMCSICGRVYGSDDCDHVAGRLYLGHLCEQQYKNVSDVDHIAIVDHPKDKGCRLATTRVGDNLVCTLTGRVKRVAEASKEGDETIHGGEVLVLRGGFDHPVSRVAMARSGEKASEESPPT